MEVLLQRHNAKCIYIVPEGLNELMSDISREVLRSQPENLYGFIADYLEALLLTRENARVAARLVQSITEIAETTASFLLNTGLERTEVDKVTTIMNEKFKEELNRAKYDRTDLVTEAEEVDMIRRVLSDSKIDMEHVEAATLIIQNAYKKFRGRKKAEEKLLSGMIDWRIAARSAIKLYRETGVTNEEVKRAATLIKAAYKGYYTRRIIKALEEEQKMSFSEPASIKLSEERSSKDSKEVRLDYDSIIPHVDFKDSDHDLISNILNDIVIKVTSKSRKPLPAKPAKKPDKPKAKKTAAKPKPPPMEQVPEEPIERLSIGSMKKKVSIHAEEHEAVGERPSQYSRRSSQRSKSDASSMSSVESSEGSHRRSTVSYKSDVESERSHRMSERSHHISERSSFVSADSVRLSAGSKSVESSAKSARSSRMSEASGKSQESSRKSEDSRKSQDVSRTSEASRKSQDASRTSEASRRLQDVSRTSEASRKSQDASRKSEDSRKSQDASRASEASRKSQEVPKTSVVSKASEASRKSQGSVGSKKSEVSQKNEEKLLECADTQRSCPLKGFK